MSDDGLTQEDYASNAEDDTPEIHMGELLMEADDADTV